MGEMLGSGETSMVDGSVGWRREDDGDEWQRWNGTWWLSVEQQNLNSRQRRKISRRLRRMITREPKWMASLLRELRNGIKAEIEETTRRHLSTFSESDELMKNEELSTDGTDCVSHLSRNSGPCASCFH